jgi:hypothetical protein
MSDEDALRKSALVEGRETPQKPRYEAPAVVELTQSAKAGVGICHNGSGDFMECIDGSAADWDCWVGFGY